MAVNAGLKAARAGGKLGGRKPKLKEIDLQKARVLLASGKYSMGKVAEALYDIVAGGRKGAVG